jgi:phage tail protein X
MTIKNLILAAMLGKLGVTVTAELKVDDVNGVSITFPDISDVAEIAEGVAVAAPDGTYVVADGDNTITMVVLGGLVTAYELTTPAPVDAVVEPSEEVLAVLEAVVEANVKANASIVALQTELKALKVSLKHEGPQAPAAAAGKTKPQFKIVG